MTRSEARPRLSLFTLNRAALEVFGRELRAALAEDSREAIVSLLELSGGLADRVVGAQRGVDLFLVPETEPGHAALYASLRRIAKKRALEQVWRSDSPALEGRLRAYEPLRENDAVASRVDALLDADRVPWFLQRSGATAGWLPSEERLALEEALIDLEDPPAEIAALSDALRLVEGDVLCHDGLG